MRTGAGLYKGADFYPYVVRVGEYEITSWGNLDFLEESSVQRYISTHIAERTSETVSSFLLPLEFFDLEYENYKSRSS